MKTLSALFGVCLLSVAHPGDAAILLTFDDLSPGRDWALIQNGYGGLKWNYFGVFSGELRPLTEGYRTGMVSPTNVAFNLYGEPASIACPNSFDLHSAYLTAAFITGMQIRVQGFLGSNLIYDHSYVVNNGAPTFIDFNYVGVDHVTFTSFPESPFVMDNVAVSVNSDGDGDGVPDDQDQCSDTPSGAVVNEHGCSIDQLVPCAGPATGGDWRNHGQYVATVAKVAQSFRRAGLITVDQKNAIVRAAAKSNCGKK
jgi:hypothetical protein